MLVTMNPTRGNNSPRWCSTLATIRLAVVQLFAWERKLLYRTNGLQLGRPGGRKRMSSTANSNVLFAGMRMA